MLNRTQGWLLPLIAIAGPMAAQDLSFARVALPAPRFANSVHLADFNGDRKLDIAVVKTQGADADSVAVLLAAPGGYGAPIITPTGGAGAWGMAVADFNHDGKPDAAVTNNLSGNVSILLGEGNGRFRFSGYVPADLSPTAIVAADFNHDGYADLAVVNGGSGNVTILLGNGDGTFRRGPSIFLGSSPTDLVSGDFNGDGIPDLAVTNGALYSQVVVMLLGNGDGTFRMTQSAAVGNEPIAVAAGDFANDGQTDLAVANLAGNDVSVLRGDGNGLFGAAATYAAGNGPSGIAVADFNLDGKLDLAVSNDASGEVAVYLGNGDGTFQPAKSFLTGGYPISIAVGDLTHDGRNDIVTAGPNGVVVLLNTTRNP